MKKLMMGLVAVLATSFAVPAFAQDKPADAAGEKPMKKKKGKKAKKAEGDAKGGAEAPAK